MGPFLPPTPSEADNDEAEPMAVARDRDTPHDFAMPTTARKEGLDRAVAERNRDPNLDKLRDATRVARAEPRPHRGEDRAMESPPGYTDADDDGWRRLRDEE